MIEQLLHKEVEQVRQELIQEHINLGMKASGKWIESTEVKTKGLRSVLWGEDYTEQLEFGREPGKYPPWDKASGKFLEIEAWIKAKRIVFDIPISSFAFLIARKWKNEGWKRKNHGGVSLVSRVLTPQRIQRIVDNIGEELTIEFANIIENEFKLVA